MGVPPPWRRARLSLRKALGLLRIIFIGRPFGHELVELGLVLGVAQAGQEGFKVGLLFLQTGKRIGLIGVKCGVSSRTSGDNAKT